MYCTVLLLSFNGKFKIISIVRSKIKIVFEGRLRHIIIKYHLQIGHVVNFAKQS
jgi:hypothetical protein